jgi:hypothetical protein
MTDELESDPQPDASTVNKAESDFNPQPDPPGAKGDDAAAESDGIIVPQAEEPADESDGAIIEF